MRRNSYDRDLGPRDCIRRELNPAVAERSRSLETPRRHAWENYVSSDSLDWLI